MKKDTIEIFRMKEHIHGYGLVTDPVNDTFILNALVQWSQNKPNVNIYQHILRKEQERIGEDGLWQKKGNISSWSGHSYDCDLPYCDLVYYLDVYYQDPP